MEIVERRDVVVDMPHPRFGERPPAIADVGAGELEPPQQAGGVDAVERLVAGELGRGVAVVIGDRLVEAAELEQEGAEVPAVVSGHEVSRAPVWTSRPEEGDPLLLPVGGFKHMGERVGRPAVGGIARQRFAADLLGAAEFARFLQAEGVGAENEAGQRIVALPGRQDARHGITDGE
jgi:hypothetical protein